MKKFFLTTSCGLVLLLTIQFLLNNGLLLAQPGKLTPSIQAAEAVVRLVLKKIQKGEILPTATVEEMLNAVP
ncbi:hypothetical protein [Dyadobacter sp. 32]|uniref:hypothetical protein n=1 Tax=Dyadobacter sp. 32 TaxID=538966 RepID=UPI0011EEAE74